MGSGRGRIAGRHHVQLLLGLAATAVVPGHTAAAFVRAGLVLVFVGLVRRHVEEWR